MIIVSWQPREKWRYQRNPLNRRNKRRKLSFIMKIRRNHSSSRAMNSHIITSTDKCCTENKYIFCYCDNVQDESLWLYILSEAESCWVTLKCSNRYIGSLHASNIWWFENLCEECWNFYLTYQQKVADFFLCKERIYKFMSVFNFHRHLLWCTLKHARLWLLGIFSSCNTKNVLIMNSFAHVIACTI